MSQRINLPPDVLEVIHANRKIEAIKLVREYHGLDLKEAKDAVEKYMLENPDLISNNTTIGGGFRVFLLILAAIVILYFLYSLFIKY